MTYLPPIPNELHTAALMNATVDGDELIAYLARLSAPHNQARMRELAACLEDASLSAAVRQRLKLELDDLTAGLIARCIRDGHFSILEMANFIIVVKTTLDIGLQIIRHKSIHVQQFSQRYSRVREPIEMPTLLTGAKDSRSPSHGGIAYPDLEERGAALLASCEAFYTDAVRCGIAKESARKFLPQQTSTLIALNGNVRDWYFYFKARRSEHAQHEHQLVAESAWELFKECYPTVASAYEMSELDGDA